MKIIDDRRDSFRNEDLPEFARKAILAATALVMGELRQRAGLDFSKATEHVQASIDEWGDRADHVVDSIFSNLGMVAFLQESVDRVLNHTEVTMSALLEAYRFRFDDEQSRYDPSTRGHVDKVLASYATAMICHRTEQAAYEAYYDLVVKAGVAAPEGDRFPWWARDEVIPWMERRL
ncbi:MAG: hypothetical protein HQL42_17205 [Alphaproteobacteria bacterium]|nr:hypothetical protein [Alphaproteobacteria bacterium]